jgi:hypothetical protein
MQVMKLINEHSEAVAVIAAYMTYNGVAEESAVSAAQCLFFALQGYQETGDLEGLAQSLGGSVSRNLEDYLTVSEVMAQEGLSERTAQRRAAEFGGKATPGEIFILIAKKRINGWSPKGVLLFPKSQRAQLVRRRKKR